MRDLFAARESHIVNSMPFYSDDSEDEYEAEERRSKERERRLKRVEERRQTSDMVQKIAKSRLEAVEKHGHLLRVLGVLDGIYDARFAPSRTRDRVRSSHSSESPGGPDEESRFRIARSIPGPEVTPGTPDHSQTRTLRVHSEGLLHQPNVRSWMNAAEEIRRQLFEDQTAIMSLRHTRRLDRPAKSGGFCRTANCKAVADMIKPNGDLNKNGYSRCVKDDERTLTVK